MSIEALLREVTSERFIAEYYLKVPYAQPRGAEAFATLGTWETVGEVLSDPSADGSIAREGTSARGERPADLAHARRLHDEGFTIVLRHAERSHRGLATMAEEFARAFGGEVDVHVYCTPAGRFGFGWHYDAEDLFLLQTSGNKEYSVRKNTVNPWPVVETLPRDMAFGRETQPLMKCMLWPGDWLYLPAGYWHRGQAETDSITLAVGVLSPTGLDVLELVRRRLLGSFLWRARLPSPGGANAISDEALHREYHELFTALGKDLEARLEDPELAREFLAARGRFSQP